MFGSGCWERRLRSELLPIKWQHMLGCTALLGKRVADLADAERWSGTRLLTLSRAEQRMLSTGRELGFRHRSSNRHLALPQRFLSRHLEDWYSQRTQPPRKPLSLFQLPCLTTLRLTSVIGSVPTESRMKSQVAFGARAPLLGDEACDSRRRWEQERKSVSHLSSNQTEGNQLMRATQPKLSELAQGELDDTGGRNSNPRLALISPQSAELGRVTKNKEVKNLCGERNIRSGMEISPENQGLWVDSSSNREALNSNFKNQGVNSGLQLSDDPIGVVTSPEFRRDSSLQLCEGIGPPSSETLRESEARITESSRVKLQRISTKKREDAIPPTSNGDVPEIPEIAEIPPLTRAKDGVQVKPGAGSDLEGRPTQNGDCGEPFMTDEMSENVGRTYLDEDGRERSSTSRNDLQMRKEVQIVKRVSFEFLPRYGKKFKSGVVRVPQSYSRRRNAGKARWHLESKTMDNHDFHR
ncbi:hypothetical protein U1Q18_016663 [Sarracenia purpurea var. burkii]